jgi:hypothetical protein
MGSGKEYRAVIEHRRVSAIRNENGLIELLSSHTGAMSALPRIVLQNSASFDCGAPI